MMRLGETSWRVCEEQPRNLIVALHVRDAAGLATDGSAQVPPLEPRVMASAKLAARATAESTQWWVRWWEAEISRGLDTGPPLYDPRAARPTSVPDDFADLVFAGLDEAHDWMAEREREHEHEHERERRGVFTPRDNAVRRQVDSITQELGRSVSPFRLDVAVLPVQGVWGQRVRADYVLVSQELRADTQRFGAFLRPAIHDLA